MPIIPTYTAKEQLDPDIRGEPRANVSEASAQAGIQQGRIVEGLGSALQSTLSSIGGRLQKQADAAPADTTAAPSPSIPSPADAHAAATATTPGTALQDTWAHRQQQAANFDAGLQDDARRQEIQTAFDKAAQDMPPNGAGYHDSFMEQADGIAGQKFTAMPAGPVKDQALRTWAAERDQWSTRAAQVQMAREAGYSQGQIAQLTQAGADEVKANPAAMDGILSTGRQRIADAPSLTPVQRAAATHAFDRTVQMAGLAAQYPNDPDGLKAALGLLDKQGQTAPAGQGGIGSDAVVRPAQAPGAPVNPDVAAKPAAGVGSDVTTMARNPAFSNATAAGRAGQAMAYFQSQGWSQAQAAGIVGNLIHESGGLNTAARNAGDGSDGSDSIGLGQWNGPRAKNLAAFAAQHGTSPTDFATQLAFVQHELTSTEGKAGAALKQATTAQDATAAVALKYERPAGSNTGVAENTAGWHNRLRNAVALAGGQFPAAGGSGSQNPRFAALSQQDVQQLIGSAEAGRSKALADQQQAQKLATIDMAHAVDNDVAAVQSSGQGSPDIDAGHVASVLGPAAAADWAARRTDALDVYKTTAAMPTMTNDELHQAVEARHPGEDDTADDYPRKAGIFVAVHDQAQKIVDARASDPAGAVSSDANVMAAAQRMQAGGGSSYEGVVQARLAAQTALGILPEAQSPITADEAKAYADHMKPAPGQDPASAADKVVQDITSRFGRYAGPVLSRVLYQATGRRDVSDVLGAALMRARSTDSGPIVTTAEGARLATGAQADAMARNTGAGLADPVVPNDGQTNIMRSYDGLKPFAGALDALNKDPSLLPLFIKRFGASRVPANLRNAAGASR